MISTTVKVDDRLLQRYNLIIQKQLQYEVSAYITESLEKRWRRLADERLNATKVIYLAGMSVTRRGKTTEMRLEGSFPVMIEEGPPSFDMKSILLAGRPFADIPFRHLAPSSAGSSREMGASYANKMGAEEARRIGRTIYEEARRLKPGQRLPEGRAPLLKDSHKTDIYADMKRTSVGLRSTYMTFRRVSENSPADSWLQPARGAKDLMGETLKELPRMLKRAINASLRNQKSEDD